jgi:predicted outer membrane repeat protein
LRLAALASFACAFSVPAAHATAYFMVGAGGTQAGCGYATIQQAVDAEAAYHGNDDRIYITRTQTYTAQAITVGAQGVRIIGGVDDCNHYEPSGVTVVSGAGGAASSVFTIRGAANVTFSNLDITDGDDGSAGAGGGIDYQGSGTLAIDHTNVEGNRAGYGGGINVNGTGGPALLVIGRETLITNNIAGTSGGGIRVEGNARLRMLLPQAFVAFNDASNGFGGGIEIVGPAQAEIASPGYRLVDYLPVIYENTAHYGGGISINGGAGSEQNAGVRLFTTDARTPVRIAGNRASHTGGGVYLQSKDGTDGGAAQLCGVDYRIDQNAAPEGSAIYADENYAVIGGYAGSDVSLYRGAIIGTPSQYCVGEAPGPLGMAICTSADCNRIDGNVAQDISGQPTAGSAILVQTASSFIADRIRIDANHGAHVLRAVGGGETYDFAGAFLDNCLVDGNQNSSDLVLGESSYSYMSFKNCTFAYNQISSGVVLRSGDTLTLQNSIVAQGSATTVAFSGGDPDELSIDSVLSMEVGSLASGDHVIQADPSFVDPGNGDFHLLPTSLAIDYAAPVTGDDRDLDNRPRDQDMPNAPNRNGVRDLGAYERQLRYCGASDSIFCDGFQFD